MSEATATKPARKPDFEETDDVAMLNKKMSRQIWFKDKLIALNKGLQEGKTAEELEMNEFELGLLAEERNQSIAQVNGEDIKVYSDDLINRVQAKIGRIKARRDEIAAS